HLSEVSLKPREVIMFARLTIATLATLICVGSTAQAAEFAAGPAYGGPNALSGTVTCTIFNFGASVVDIPIRQIWISAGGSVNLTHDSCHQKIILQHNESCEFAGRIEASVAYSCRVATAGTDDTKVTGALVIQSSNRDVIVTLPLTQ